MGLMAREGLYVLLYFLREVVLLFIIYYLRRRKRSVRLFVCMSVSLSVCFQAKLFKKF